MNLKTLLLTGICFTGCLSTNAAESGPGDKIINEISGSVVDADSKKPLKEVAITAYSDSKKEKIILSDESGRFDFDELKSGIYKLVFEKAGYRKVTREKVSIKADETLLMRIEMLEDTGFDLMPSPFHFMDTK
jgi:5-hydroxyisourate hydrolase-like protein (transthyretin family)